MTGQQCPFCDIASGAERDQVVHADSSVVAFMDLYPATDGHLLVAPVHHRAGLGDLDEETGTAMWRAGHRAAAALRRSGLRCEGINLLLCDGAAAGQSVFHVHLHVIPRYRGDGIVLRAGHGRASPAESELRERAGAIRACLARTAGPEPDRTA
jgi:histidine triad (HIT) family protein